MLGRNPTNMRVLMRALLEHFWRLSRACISRFFYGVPGVLFPISYN